MQLHFLLFMLSHLVIRIIITFYFSLTLSLLFFLSQSAKSTVHICHVIPNVYLFMILFMLSQTYSYDPSSPYSSTAQEAKTMVLLGLQPDFTMDPKTRAISIRAQVPLLGSAAPYPQESLWLPWLFLFIYQILKNNILLQNENFQSKDEH